MSRAVVGRWGKNLAIRFPAEIAEIAALREGEAVEITTSGEDVIVRKLPAKLTLEALFAGKSPEEWREFYRDAYDWGPDVGREIVEE